MLTLEQLNKLRGIKPNKPESISNNKADTTINETIPSVNNATYDTKSELPEPIEISCKNYTDEEGHFAYIDANTHKILHVNLDNGKVYTQDEVNQLSFKKATNFFPNDCSLLTWQEVVTDNTLYDKFGSPVFVFEEIDKALQKKLNSKNTIPTDNELKSTAIDDTSADDERKTDSWGLPL